MITFFSDLVPDNITNKLFSLLENNSFLVGWGDDEFALVSEASKYNTFVHAADWAMNVGTLSNFPVNKTIQKSSTKG